MSNLNIDVSSSCRSCGNLAVVMCCFSHGPDVISEDVDEGEGEGEGGHGHDRDHDRVFQNELFQRHDGGR